MLFWPADIKIKVCLIKKKNRHKKSQNYYVSNNFSLSVSFAIYMYQTKFLTKFQIKKGNRDTVTKYLDTKKITVIILKFD